MVNLGPPWTHRSIAEALGPRAISAYISAILAAHFQNVCKDRRGCTPEIRLGRVVHLFLEELASEMYLVPGL